MKKQIDETRAVPTHSPLRIRTGVKAGGRNQMGGLADARAATP